MPELTCATCHAPFTVDSARASRTGRLAPKYCGQPCANVGQGQVRSENYRAAWPSETELRQMYEVERLSTRAIAARVGADRTCVPDWLRAYGIPVRPKGRGLANRGVQMPTAEELHRLVHGRHLGQKEIGALYGVDGAAVYHWLRKLGVPPATPLETWRKGRVVTLPSRDELSALYESGQSCEAIAATVGVHASTIANLCERYGILLRPDGWTKGGRLVCTDGHRVRSTYEQRVDEWLTEHGIAHEYEPVTPFDRRSRADFLANGWHIEVWGVTTDPKYIARKKRKTALYRAHRLPLIEIPQHAFHTAHKRMWERRLRACLTAPDHE